MACVKDCFFNIKYFFLLPARAAWDSFGSFGCSMVMQFPSVTNLGFSAFLQRLAKMASFSFIALSSVLQQWVAWSEADLEQNLRLQLLCRECLKSAWVGRWPSVLVVFLGEETSALLLGSCAVRVSVRAQWNLGLATGSGGAFLLRKSSRSLFLLVSCVSFQGEIQPSSATSERTRSFLPIIDKYINQSSSPLNRTIASLQILFMSRPEISLNNSNAGRPPVSPSNRNANGSNQELYLSRFNEGLPDERLHKSKSKSTKLKQSAKDQKLETTMKVNDNVVTVKEEKVMLNSTVNASAVKGFEDLEFQDKKIKKFSITALIKEKDLIKESNYFDESHLGESDIRPITGKERADFRIGQFQQFETFQVKTFLFDRNLLNKIEK